MREKVTNGRQPWPIFFVTRTLTRDLFVVANLLVTINVAYFCILWKNRSATYILRQRFIGMNSNPRRCKCWRWIMYEHLQRMLRRCLTPGTFRDGQHISWHLDRVHRGQWPIDNGILLQARIYSDRPAGLHINDRHSTLTGPVLVAP